MKEPNQIKDLVKRAKQTMDKMKDCQSMTNMPDSIPFCPFEDRQCSCGVMLKPRWSDFMKYWSEAPERCEACEDKKKLDDYYAGEASKLIENSGFGKRHVSMTLDNYRPKNKTQVKAKEFLYQALKELRPTKQDILEHKIVTANIPEAKLVKIGYHGYEITDKCGCSHYANFPRPKLGRLPVPFLYGPVGTGKTHLVSGYAFRLINEFLIPVKFIVGVNLLHKIRATFSPDNQDDAEDLIEQYSEAPLLILDDLGAEKPSDFVRETFYLIIDNRYNSELPTIVTSNLTPKQLAVKLDDRIISRLLQGAAVMKIDGEDIRLKNGLKTSGRAHQKAE